MGFRLLEHTADLGIEAQGADLCAALDQAVVALGEVLAGPGQADPGQRRPLAMDAGDREGLVVALLSECLFLLEVEGWLARGARLTLADGAIRGEFLGEPYDRGQHDGLAIKAITWHQLDVVEHSDGVTLTVFLDC